MLHQALALKLLSDMKPISKIDESNLIKNKATYSSCRVPMVSVIMNGYNCERYLRQAIDSVFSQTYEDWEIIFWDNASTDSTQSIVLSYGEKVRYFRSKENTSLGTARNNAIRQINSEFVAFLDTDDYWLPDKLAMQVNFFRSNKDVDFIYGNCYLLDQKTRRQRKWLRRQQPTGNVFGLFLKYYPVNLQTVLLRRSTLDSVDHFFDHQLNLSEEFDLFMRILYRSKAHYIDEPTVVYRIHENMLSIKNMEKYPEENRLVLNKLLAIDVSIADMYADEIAAYEKKIAFSRARADMHSHKPAYARLALRPYMFRSIVFLGLYFGTFSRILWTFLLEINKRLR